MATSQKSLEAQSSASSLADSRTTVLDRPKAGESRASVRQIFWSALNVVNHLLVLVVTCYLLYEAIRSPSTTSTHVILCTLGYVLLMAEGIAVLAGENVLTGCLSRRICSHLHWILQLVGVALGVAGIVVMYRAKDGGHFQSNHAITGIASVAAAAAVVLSGVPALFAASLRKTIRPVLGKLLHNFLGIGCFAVGMTSQCLGYETTHWLSSKVGPEVVLACTVSTALITLFSLPGALRSLTGQVAGCFS